MRDYTGRYIARHRVREGKGLTFTFQCECGLEFSKTRKYCLEAHRNGWRLACPSCTKRRLRPRLI